MRRLPFCWLLALIVAGCSPVLAIARDKDGRRELLMLGLRAQAGDPGLAASASEVLKAAGADGQEAVPRLIGALGDEQEEIRAGAAAALPAARAAAVPALTKALSSALGKLAARPDPPGKE